MVPFYRQNVPSFAIAVVIRTSITAFIMKGLKIRKSRSIDWSVFPGRNWVGEGGGKKGKCTTISLQEKRKRPPVGWSNGKTTKLKGKKRDETGGTIKPKSTCQQREHYKHGRPKLHRNVGRKSEENCCYQNKITLHCSNSEIAERAFHRPSSGRENI